MLAAIITIFLSFPGFCEKVSINTSPEAPARYFTSDTLKANTAFEKAQEKIKIGEYIEAKTHLDTALHYYQKTGLKKNQIAGLCELAKLAGKQGHFTEAYKYINRAENLETKGPTPDIGPIILHTHALLNYLQGHFNQSIKDAEKACAFYEKEYRTNDLIKCYNILGACYLYTGRYQEAIATFKKAVRTAGENSDYIYNLYNSIGGAYERLGDYDRALQYLTFSLDYYKTIGPASNPVAMLNSNIGMIYGTKEQYKEAKEMFVRARTIYEHNKQQDTNYFNTLNNLAEIHILMQEYAQAFSSIKKCIALREKRLGKNHPHLIPSLVILGNIYTAQKQYNAAEKSFKRAEELVLMHFGQHHPDFYLVYSGLAQISIEKNDQEKALYYLQKSLIGNSLTFKSMNPDKNPGPGSVFSKQYFIDTLYKKARILGNRASGQITTNLKQALSALDLAILVNQDIKNFSKVESSKLYHAENIDKIYETAILMCIKLYKSTLDGTFLFKAFSLSEKNKASILRTALSKFQARHFSHLPDSLINKESYIQNQLVLLESQLYDLYKSGEKSGCEKIHKLENEIFHLKNTYWDLVQFFEKHYPRYTALKHKNTVADVRTIQNFIQPDQAVVEFTLTDSVLIAFCIAKDHFGCWDIKIDTTFFDHLEFVIHKIKSPPDYKGDREIELNVLLNELYVTLFSQFEDRLKNKRTIIIPDGLLGYLSFDVLLTEKYEPQDSRIPPYLIKSHALSYHYSSTLLIESEWRKNRAFKNIMALFAPSFVHRGQGAKNNTDTIRKINMSISPLFGNKNEVESVHKITGGDIFCDSLATETKFKQIAKNYQLIHIATHGIADDERPMFSKLFFTPGRTADLEEAYMSDGHVNACEIFNMSLTAEQVVLSACDTGTGKLQNGEGIMSLARAFLYAGVPSLVVSLWEVNDHLALPVFTQYYKQLKSRKPKDQALRSAKLEYLSHANNLSRAPYYWAPFIVIGSTKPVRFGRNFILMTGIFLTFALLATATVYYIKRPKRRGNDRAEIEL